jgi:hypothetical protein
MPAIESFVVGEKIQFDADLATLAGAPINGTVTLTILRPDRVTEDTPSVSTDATGSYIATYSTIGKQPGIYRYRWESTGSTEAAKQGKFELLVSAVP